MLAEHEPVSHQEKQVAQSSKLKVRLKTHLYASLSAAGVFYLIANKPAQSDKYNEAKTLLLNILLKGHQEPVSQQLIKQWGENLPLKESIKFFYRFQQLDYIRGLGAPQELPIRGPMEEIIPSYLAKLCSSGQGVLADHQGLYISSAGYPHEVAEELAAMSVDLMALQERHQRLLKNNLKMASESLAVVDGKGRSQLDFVPIYIGETRFCLVLSGVVQLESLAFINLVKLLAQKYY